MNRPYEVPAGRVVGVLGLLLSGFFVYLYLPGGASALAWPHEWLIVILWSVLGVVLYGVSEGHTEGHVEDVIDRLENLENLSQ